MAEQGDFVEIRLAERTPSKQRWLLSDRSGDARLEAQGEAVLVRDETGLKRVFRFRAMSIGTSQLTFTLHGPPGVPRNHNVLTFKIIVR